MNEQIEIMKGLQKDDKRMSSKLADAEREREIFRCDKVYLEKELDVMRSNNSVLMSEKENLSARCLNLDGRVAELMEQLISSRSAAELNFDEKNRRELDSLRTLILKESEASRLSAEETYDREIRSLKENIISLHTEINFMKSEKNSIQDDHSKATIDLATKLQTTELELNELRSSLKMKTFELTSLGKNGNFVLHYTLTHRLLFLL